MKENLTANTPTTLDDSKDQKGFKQFVLKCGLESNVKYRNKDDFILMKNEKILKVLIIGEIGTGKSSMISKMMGVKFVHNCLKRNVEWKSEHGELIRVDTNQLLDHFPASNTSNSVTKESSFVISRLMGNETRRPVMLIDTPGLFDPEENAIDEVRENLGIGDQKRVAEDLKEKLEVLGSVDAVVLLMPLSGGRVTNNLVLSMKALEHMFRRSRGKYISNLALVMSKCDEWMLRNYQQQMDNRENEYITIIGELQKYGLEVSKNNTSQLFFLTAADETIDSIGRIDELNRLFKFFNCCSPLFTDQIQDPTAIIQGQSYQYFVIIP